MQNEQSNDETNKIYVILTCGIPASGKSTFTSNFSKYITSKEPHQSFQVDNITIIEYDSITESIFIEANKDNKHQNKNNTEKILEAWKSSRIKAFEELEDKLSKLESTNQTNVILLDDNFYLRSMRRELYRKCQERCSDNQSVSYYFSVIYFAIDDVSTCIQRNESRNADNIVRCIPDEVIYRMNDKLEAPSLDNNWEYPFIISNTNSESLFDQMLHHMNTIPPVKQKVEPNIEQIENDRKITQANMMHSIDMHLRYFVKSVCGLNRRLGKDVNSIRKVILDDYKKNGSARTDDLFRDCLDRFIALLLNVPDVDEDFIIKLRACVDDDQQLK